MKKFIFSSLVGLALIAFTGCTGDEAKPSIKSSIKCAASGKCSGEKRGAGKCTKGQKVAKKATKGVKCAARGKCGDGKCGGK